MRIAFGVLVIVISACSQPKNQVTTLSEIEIGDDFEFVDFNFENNPDSTFLKRMFSRNIRPESTYTLERIKTNPMGATMYWFVNKENNRSKAFDRHQAGMILVKKIN